MNILQSVFPETKNFLEKGGFWDNNHLISNFFVQTKYICIFLNLDNICQKKCFLQYITRKHAIYVVYLGLIYQRHVHL